MTDPDWMLHGQCRGVADPDLFFPDAGGASTAKAAKRVCRPCPVRRTCLEWQLERAPVESRDFGVWGGTSPTERERIRQ